MEKTLSDKVAIITGGSRGIGKAIALRLAERGANIIINYVRNDETAKQTVEELNTKGINALPFRANVKEPKEIDDLIKFALDEFGTIDILIHNAAIGAFKPVHLLKPNQWQISMEVNAQAFLHLSQKVLPVMEKKGSGSIVAISSVGSHRVIPTYGAIGISKAALETLVKYLSVEFAPKGIRVNCVSGGPIETDALKFFPEYATLKKEAVAETPAGRMGQPDDLARVVAFLVSPESGWIYGQTIVADGGISLA